jgi:predicted nuclease of restriction endonuclease-like (RecB) superfamily
MIKKRALLLASKTALKVKGTHVTKVISKKSKSPATKEYVKVLLEIKQHIREAQIKAAFSVNKELLKLYWTIGQTINKQQKINGWGSKSIEKLAQDIQDEFPGLEGFSRSNIFRIQAFFMAYDLVAQAARQLDDLPIFNIPWFHNVIIIQKIKTSEERLWYAQKAIENGWSRSMLETWIESDLFNRQGAATTNFKRTLPEPDSDMAQQALKDPYNFGFLTLHEQHVEKDIEQGLWYNITGCTKCY